MNAGEQLGDVRDPELRLAIAAQGGVTTFGDAPIGALLTVDFGEGPRWARVTCDERRKVLALGTATEPPDLAGDDVVMFRPTDSLMVVVVDGPTCTR